ncbi:amidohydrolase [Clostridium sp. 'deep sea']|uniref:amidohydrolase n=1 Tax=Clostridium sp. 'deep sea' TaxID=2779445 RepID=UPI001896694E|nr:amidohydrolase [Clostridium sp. 'deep sea']QOR36121.1 amidohydrolase [Clostridium sp. 'deep sea']
MKAFINATIYPASSPKIENGTLLIDNNKIKAVGKNIDLPENCEVVDCKGAFILPGFVDSHTHVGIWGEGEGAASYDGNEGTNPVTPHVRAFDAINPFHSSFADARMGGVTTVEITPGSGNAIGGQMCVLKTGGTRIDQMVLSEFNGVKAALGENPKRFYGTEKKVFPSTRMGTAAAIRKALFDAQEYQIKRYTEDIAIDLKLEPLVALLNKEVPLRVHAHRADDIVTAIRIGEEFDIKIQIEHGTDSAIIADYLATKDIVINLGPSFWNRAKIETQSVSFATAGVLEKAGVKFSLISDHPFFPIQYVSMSVALAHAEGMTKEGALKAYTLWAAENIGVADRVGSLESGKDADFTIWDADPYSIYSKIRFTYCDGKIVFEQ